MSSATIPTGVYYIQNVATDMALDLPDGRTMPYSPLRGWPKYELGDVWAPVQLWVITPKDYQEEAYTIQNASGRNCAELTTASDQVLCNLPSGAKSQQWKFTRNDTGAYVIQNLETGSYITLDKGAQIVGRSGAAKDEQLWKIIPV